MISTESNPSAWNDALLRNPHIVADKRRRVQEMFSAIAPSYDLNNRLHSLWMDQSWRRKAVRLAGLKPSEHVVDVACGTGDLALLLAGRLATLGEEAGARFTPAGRVIGIDFTFAMLPLARKKCDSRSRGRATFPVTSWINGDALCLPLPDASADVLSIAFGIRNVSNPGAGVQEFYRVLRPGGRLVILEFSLPTHPVLRGLYNFYFRKILPRSATLISGDKTGAYKYLPESVNTFIGRDQMLGLMNAAGFSEVSQHPITFGVCVAYRGVKR